MIVEIKGKLSSAWNENVKAVVDIWTSYSLVTVDDFKDAILTKGLSYAKEHGGIAWIVDSSQAEGIFSAEIQDFIEKDVFPAFASSGIKYFITITSTKSALARMAVSSYSAKAGPNGLELVEVKSVEDAVEWLKLQQ